MQWFRRAETPANMHRGACEVCGFLTVDADSRGLYDICPVCFWEDDGFHKDPDEPCGGPNGDLSVNQARANFKASGACRQDLIPHTRKPLPEEIPSLTTPPTSSKVQVEFDELKRQLEAAKANMPEDVREAHTHTVRHREEILASERCGCFYCKSIFAPDKIEEWVDDDDCALCPECGIDSVIGDQSGYPITKEFLSKMHRYWFT